MSKKVMTDWGEVEEPNQDDSLSKVDILRLKNALSSVLSKFPKYKQWILAVEFRRETFHPNNYVFLTVYLNDCDMSHMDVLDMETNFTEDNPVFAQMLYECEVLGSMGYIEDITDDWIYIEPFIRNEIRGKKINDLLDNE
jgi:hypothetical protein